jgi:hypothetical protein
MKVSRFETRDLGSVLTYKVISTSVLIVLDLSLILQFLASELGANSLECQSRLGRGSSLRLSIPPCLLHVQIYFIKLEFYLRSNIVRSICLSSAEVVGRRLVVAPHPVTIAPRPSCLLGSSFQVEGMHMGLKLVEW